MRLSPDLDMGSPVRHAFQVCLWRVPLGLVERDRHNFLLVVLVGFCCYCCCCGCGCRCRCCGCRALGLKLRGQTCRNPKQNPQEPETPDVPLDSDSRLRAAGAVAWRAPNCRWAATAGPPAPAAPPASAAPVESNWISIGRKGTRLLVVDFKGKPLKTKITNQQALSV